MRQISFRSLALSAAVGAIALGGAILSPSSASAAPLTERSAIGVTLGHGQPVEMQRRGGGFRGGGFRGGGWGRGRGYGFYGGPRFIAPGCYFSRRWGRVICPY